MLHIAHTSIFNFLGPNSVLILLKACLTLGLPPVSDFFAQNLVADLVSNFFYLVLSMF